jgi:heptosyltransferase-2
MFSGMSVSKPRILAIRGGAIGDFILTLPAIRLLRETFAHCHLEILGYQHIATLAAEAGPAAGQTYADAVRSIEAGPLAGFFARNGNLSDEWCAYFASFNQVVSWLFDPDEIFEANIKRAGVKNYLSAYARIDDQSHATAQLARGLERMALFLDEATARLVPSESAQRSAAVWLRERGAEIGHAVAIHPGSGSAKKNWPVERWREVAERLRAEGRHLLLIGGEADDAALSALSELTPLIARHLPLPVLAALLSQCAGYYGHDTGISHLAAATGIPATLLFGPTDPSIWAPQGKNVRIITAPDGELSELAVKDVVAA